MQKSKAKAREQKEKKYKLFFFVILSMYVSTLIMTWEVLFACPFRVDVSFLICSE